MEQIAQIHGREINDILVGSLPITIVHDYRLVDSGVQFPGAAQDVRDAIQWVIDNLPFPNFDIYILGHSAEVMNILTELYSPTLHSHNKGAILLSGCYMFEDVPADVKDSIRLCYDKDTEAKKRVPLALLDSASVPTPRLLLGIGNRDIPCLHPTMEKFSEPSKAKGVSYDEFVAQGHNHVSLVFALGTWQGEEWAEDAVKWIHALRVPYHLMWCTPCYIATPAPEMELVTKFTGQGE
ncbi:hypothetical protein EDD85DRAFT_774662 [Armillaria nabsnona]|nr:hypothetical protein EDD85DRAFT_774662 [Armillaria nabsnona]